MPNCTNQFEETEVGSPLIAAGGYTSSEKDNFIRPFAIMTHYCLRTISVLSYFIFILLGTVLANSFDVLEAVGISAFTEGVTVAKDSTQSKLAWRIKTRLQTEVTASQESLNNLFMNLERSSEITITLIVKNDNAKQSKGTLFSIDQKDLSERLFGLSMERGNIPVVVFTSFNSDNQSLKLETMELDAHGVDPNSKIHTFIFIFKKTTDRLYIAVGVDCQEPGIEILPRTFYVPHASKFQNYVLRFGRGIPGVKTKGFGDYRGVVEEIKFHFDKGCSRIMRQYGCGEESDDYILSSFSSSSIGEMSNPSQIWTFDTFSSSVPMESTEPRSIYPGTTIQQCSCEMFNEFADKVDELNNQINGIISRQESWPATNTPPSNPEDFPFLRACHFDNVLRNVGDEWQVGNCTTCRCELNDKFPTVRCDSIQCLHVKCEDVPLLHKECCPVCLASGNMPTEPREPKNLYPGTTAQQCSCEVIYGLADKIDALSNQVNDISSGQEAGPATNAPGRDPKEFPFLRVCRYDKVLRKVGDEWQVGNCTTCRCELNSNFPLVRCDSVQCLPVDCVDVQLIPGECCPVCSGYFKSDEKTLHESFHLNLRKLPSVSASRSMPMEPRGPSNIYPGTTLQQCSCEMFNGLADRIALFSNRVNDIMSRKESVPTTNEPQRPLYDDSYYDHLRFCRFDNALRNVGDEWYFGNCITCHCELVQGSFPIVRCERIQCEPVNCAHVDLIPVECCPVCR